MARVLNQIFGHNKTKEFILRSIERNRWPSCSMLVGPSGVGKSLLAKSIAQELLCDQLSEACGACSTCLKIENGENELLLHLTPEKGVLKIEEAQKIHNFLRLQNWGGKGRVIIIEDAHLLNTQAANSLLKRLEEPPQNTYFVLTAVSISAVMPTIKSRSQIIPVSILNSQDLKGVEGIEPWMLSSSMGRMDLLDQFREKEISDLRGKFLDLLSKVLDEEPLNLAKSIQELFDGKDDFILACSWARQILRDAVYYKEGLSPLIHQDLIWISEKFSVFNSYELQWMFEYWQQIEKDILSNLDRQLTLESFFIKANSKLKTGDLNL